MRFAVLLMVLLSLLACRHGSVHSPLLTAGPHHEYRLSPRVYRDIQALFREDLGDITVTFTDVWGDAPSYTLWSTIFMDLEVWRAETEEQQFRSLVHEVTHCVQYERLGAWAFFQRYHTEHKRKDNYDVPLWLSNTPVEQVDLVSSAFTLDQLAERMADESERYYPRVAGGAPNSLYVMVHAVLSWSR
jgi:hypothetical protein